jgi:hypothetical protein
MLFNKYIIDVNYFSMLNMARVITGIKPTQALETDSAASYSAT